MCRVWIILLSAGLVPSIALAQNALGGGRALDAGLSTAPGGRVNTPVQDLQAIVRYNNALVTGGVPGGKSLRVPVEYRPLGDFRTSPRNDFFTSPNRDSTNPLRSLDLARSFSYGGALGGPAARLGTRADAQGRDAMADGAGRALSARAVTQRVAYTASAGRIAEPLVGFVTDDKGRVFRTRGSTLLGVKADGTIEDLTAGVGGGRRVEMREDVLSPFARRDDKSDSPPKGTTDETRAKAGEKPAGIDARGEVLRRLREKLAGAPEAKPAPKPDQIDPLRRADTPTPMAATASEMDIAALRAMSSRLETLIPPGASSDRAYAAYMTLGQEALAAGRYGPAESMFESAMGHRSRDPMARVGKLHASLGVGLLSSSGLVLMNLYEDEPQLITQRYEPALLLPRARAGVLVENLRDDLKRGDGALFPLETPLVLAYLGRHFDNPQWLREGLDGLATTGLTDPKAKALHDVLSGAWK